MFWGMLEMGVGIVAVCLPTLRPIFHGFSPESILRTVRSLVSLRSDSMGSRSKHSREGYVKDPNNSESKNSLTRPGKALVPDTGVQNEAHAWPTRTDPSQESSYEMDNLDGVWINKNFTQAVSHV